MAYFYTFNPTIIPTGLNHTKAGITYSNPTKRLGKYQLAYGPFWEASFSWICYHKDPKIIKWIENSVLGHFRHKCCTLGAGMTEWLVTTTWEEIRDYVLLICKDNNIEVKDHNNGPWTSVKIIQEKI